MFWLVPGIGPVNILLKDSSKLIYYRVVLSYYNSIIHAIFTNLNFCPARPYLVWENLNTSR